jgi:hypothetical protein
MGPLWEISSSQHYSTIFSKLICSWFCKHCKGSKGSS